MKQVASITLTGFNASDIETVLGQLDYIRIKTNVFLGGPFCPPSISAPVPLRMPDGRKQINFLNMYQCQVFLEADERALRLMMRINVPDGVNIQIMLRDL